MIYTKISCSYHKHELILKKPEVPCICDGCMGLVFSPCYECKYKRCNFHLHQECALPKHSFIHKFFKDLEFKFHKTAPGKKERYCDACGIRTPRFVYQSRCTKYNLHPHCAKLPHEIPSKDGSMILRLRKEAPSSCSKCKLKYVSNSIKGWCYVSSCKEYCFHVGCVEQILLENWQNYYFRTKGKNNNDKIATSLALPSQKGAKTIKKGPSPTGEKAVKIAKKAAFFLAAIMSGIFGEPVTFFVAFTKLVISN